MDGAWVDRLERRFGFLAAPGLPGFITGMTVLVGVLGIVKPEFADILSLDPFALARGQLWRCVSFLFVPPPAGPLWLIFWILMLYSILQALEHAWGEFKFTVFLLIGVLATAAGALATGAEFGNSFVILAAFLAFARLMPDREVLIMFVLPVKMRWLAGLAAVWLVLEFVTNGLPTRVELLTGLLPYFLFFGEGHRRELSRLAEMAPKPPMIAALLAAAVLSAPARAATVKLFAFDEKGAALSLPGLLARLARADDKKPEADKAAFWAFPLDEKDPPARVKLAQLGPLLTATWPGGPARLELVWPVKEDGYSQVSADNGGNGFADGSAVFLDEEIALTQYRLFKESWARRTTDSQPLYSPGKKAKALADDAKKAMADAAREKEAPKRAAAFEDALRLTALAWEKELYAHGLQLALDERRAKQERFGLTFDDTLLKRMDDVDWLAEAVERSGSDWVRLVFRPNGTDFTYASLRSFNEYDGVVKELRKRKIKILGAILDTAQWPKTLTPEAYAERVKNIVLHYKGQVSSWEVGSEINGDWLGGASEPLSLDRVFAIYSAGAAKAKELDPETETMATLYWWDATAPDRAHSLAGWLKRYVPKGFGRDADVIGLELYPEDNPVGMQLEKAFDTAADAMPRQKLMLSSFGYVEKDQLKGYWWLAPDDVDGGRKDLLILYTVASCAMRSSVCGGFWWQTLDQMLPVGHHKATELFKVDVHTLTQLGRKEK